MKEFARSPIPPGPVRSSPLRSSTLVLVCLVLLAPPAYVAFSSPAGHRGGEGSTSLPLAREQADPDPHPAGVTAPTSVSWTNLTPSLSNSPPPLAQSGLAFDANDGYSVLFGGVDPGYGILSVTWTFRSGVWTNISSSVTTAPPARLSMSMTYDSSDGYVLLFGGCVGFSLAGGNTCYDRSDTWTFSGGQWTNITGSAGTAPSARADAAMDYESFLGRAVLFGGCPTSWVATGCVSPGSDTWTFHAGTWSSLPTSTSPAGRGGSALVYDPADGYSLLFGGMSGGSALGDAWKLTGSVWKQVSTPAPSNRVHMEGVFDSAYGYLLFFGGWTGHTALTGAPEGFMGDTWKYVGGNWTNLTSLQPSAPGPRAWSLTYDPVAQVALGFGGFNGAQIPSDTWTYGASSAPPIQATASATPTSGTAPLMVAVSAWATGGSPPYSWSWNFGDGIGTSTSRYSNYTYNSAGSFTPTLTVTDTASGNNIQSVAILVNSPSSVSVTLSATPTSGPSPLTVYFDSGATGGFSPYTFFWQFGDGQTTTWSNKSVNAHIAHTYSSPGTYSASVTATDTRSSSASQIVSVSVGSSSSLSVALSATPNSGFYPLTVYFQGSASGGSGPYSFEWDFGDGRSLTWANTSSSVHVGHTYTSGGSFSAQLKATDRTGANTTTSTIITVSSRGPSLSSTVNVNPTSGSPPLSVSFSSSIQGGTGPYVLIWRPGDGSPSTWQNCSSSSCPAVQHTYGQSGKFMVESVVSDSSSPSQVNIHFVNITVGQGSSSGALQGTVNCNPSTHNGPPSGTAPFTISCQASASGGTPPYSYLWNLANTTRFTGPWINYTFQNPGYYYVNLTISDQAGDHYYSAGEIHVLSGNGPGTGGIGSGGPLNLGAPGGVPTLFVILAAVGIVALSLVALLSARRKRRACLAAGAATAASSPSGPAAETVAAAPAASGTPPGATVAVAEAPPATASTPTQPPTTAALPASEPTVAEGARCASCGSPLEAGAGFCDNCGKPAA